MNLPGPYAGNCGGQLDLGHSEPEPFPFGGPSADDAVCHLALEDSPGSEREDGGDEKADEEDVEEDLMKRNTVTMTRQFYRDAGVHTLWRYMKEQIKLTNFLFLENVFNLYPVTCTNLFISLRLT